MPFDFYRADIVGHKKVKLPVQYRSCAFFLARYFTVTDVFVAHSSERKGGSAITMSNNSRKQTSELLVDICPNDIGDL